MVPVDIEPALVKEFADLSLSLGLPVGLQGKTSVDP